jgi:hypothetical protein
MLAILKKSTARKLGQWIAHHQSICAARSMRSPVVACYVGPSIPVGVRLS